MVAEAENDIQTAIFKTSSAVLTLNRLRKIRTSSRVKEQGMARCWAGCVRLRGPG
jgi:hypothetical protein